MNGADIQAATIINESDYCPDTGKDRLLWDYYILNIGGNPRRKNCSVNRQKMGTMPDCGLQLPE